jgi:hypothetical protein
MPEVLQEVDIVLVDRAVETLANINPCAWIGYQIRTHESVAFKVGTHCHRATFTT